MKPVKLPLSKGYLLVDSRACTGCRTCMLACSLVHEGKVSLAQSRIHVIQELLEPFPNDIILRPCRQCIDPACVDACTTGALHVDSVNGNVRTISETDCIGCKDCLDACPHVPQGIVWNPERNVAMKCDLCANTSYWIEKGGPYGKQACIEFCPVKAIAFTTEAPTRFGNRP